MKIKDVLHLYLPFKADFFGIEIDISSMGGAAILSENIRPKFRRLSSMTEQEAKDLGVISTWSLVYYSDDGFTWKDASFSPEQLVNLLKAGFWLFGDEAFDKGEIIEIKS